MKVYKGNAYIKLQKHLYIPKAINIQVVSVFQVWLVFLGTLGLDTSTFISKLAATYRLI